ncbi:hypothetical protein AB0N09_07735 [Streptomyces erythrochromogenes]|uniref:hypothetical protein n=1 Tax=Streptomyces erythrochromogenes TaxID=285574 RepID=UPI003413E5CC
MPGLTPPACFAGRDDLDRAGRPPHQGLSGFGFDEEPDRKRSRSDKESVLCLDDIKQ